MSLKEFDAKQFLLEKGERVGLGVAVGLMVLMLIFSLFMPSNGFFSGSPSAKASALKTGTEQLETALSTRTPGDNDKPEKREGGMPTLDKSLLDPENYVALAWFEPSIKESPARRPPKILNVVEAVAEPAHVLIDTYLFDKDFAKVWILDDKKGGTAAGGANPFGSMYNRGAGGMGMGPQMGNFFRQNQSRLRNNFNPGALQGVGADDKAEYEPKLISTENWNPQQQLTAHQPRPLRVAVIAGSFPYREQLEEFKRQLRLADTDAVLAETIDAEEDKPNAFRFLGVKVQRADVDENGKPGNWSDLPLAETYELWLKHTSYPFQPENPKYEPVKYPGLVAPLLREFHPDRLNDLSAMMPGLGLPGLGNAAQAKPAEAAEDLKTKYPDPAAKLEKLQETLAKLQGTQAKKIAAPKSKSKGALFDPFNPSATPPSDRGALVNEPNADKDSTVPDYCLMRFVDVNLQAGKRYRYRFKIRMANPNYGRSDVASPDYKKNKELESKEWFEVKETVAVPPELYYYVADDLPAGLSTSALRREMPPPQSARYQMWKSRPHTDQVVLQFHRWVEATPISRREGDMMPVGDWAIADRVFVSRGENVGRRVRVDLPIWKYVQNSYVLPTEELPKKGANRRMATTGIDVDFGGDNPERETILLDFEGGRVSTPSKLYDTCRLEVLMLSPDGKLLARNNAVDTTDEDRQKRRQEALDRIKEIREGKPAQ